MEELRWYTITKVGKHETILKRKSSWVKKGYKVEEHNNEVHLIKE